MMAALPKLTDEEARYLSRDELLRRYRDLEGSYLRMASDRGSMMKDLNQRMQIHLTEIRSLKDVNRRLQDDIQELRDLCCFLDDDRQKARKLAREWQRFGRYTSSVMRSEVAAYQQKLKELEQQQEGLVLENFELKELCLFLDSERDVVLPSSAGRAEADGSSNSSGAPDKLLSEERGLGFEVEELQLTPVRDTYSELMSSLRGPIDTSPLSPPPDSVSNQATPPKFFSTPSLGDNPSKRPPLAPMTSLPTLQPPQATDAVTNARKVLQVHEELEQNSAPEDAFSEEMSDAEKAIVREMCNVVWRKLGDAVPGYNTPV